MKTKLSLASSPAPTTPLRVAAYARVSTLNQVLEHDSSVDTQIERIRLKAEYENKSRGRPWHILSEYREEGRSGKNTDRPELQRLLADIRAGRIDVVCVTKVDRITRSLSDFYTLWDIFEKHAVEFISLGENLDSSNATGRAMIKLILVFAELERERTSERTKEKIEMRKRQGLWYGGVPPLGYKSHPTDKTTLLLADEATQHLVREQIFRRYLEVGSAHALCRYLSRAGIRTPRRITKRADQTGGRHFTSKNLIEILSNPIYVAKRALDDGTFVKCSWAPLIDEELFDTVQARLALNREKRPSGRLSADYVYLLEGLLRCGKCGAGMIRSWGKGNGGQYFYYKCARKAKTANEGCPLKSVPAAAVENVVLSELSQYVVDRPALAAAVRDLNAGRADGLLQVRSELKNVADAVSTKKGQVEKLLDLLEGDGDDVVALRRRIRERQAELLDLERAKTDLEHRRELLERDLIESDAVAAAYSSLGTLLDEAVRKGARQEIRSLLQSLVDVVEWRESPGDPTRGEAVIQLFPLPIAPANDGGVKQPGESSPSCYSWLRRRVSNPRPGG